MDNFVNVPGIVLQEISDRCGEEAGTVTTADWSTLREGDRSNVSGEWLVTLRVDSHDPSHMQEDCAAVGTLRVLTDHEGARIIDSFVGDWTPDTEPMQRDSWESRSTGGNCSALCFEDSQGRTWLMTNGDSEAPVASANTVALSCESEYCVVFEINRINTAAAFAIVEACKDSFLE